jgi:hypothetical protein
VEFEFIKSPAFRGMAIVGDTLVSVVGKPVGSYPTLSFNVTDQPTSSDVFNGLGTGGNDVPYTSIGSATFSHSGWHTFTVAGANGQAMAFDVVVFPAAALSTPTAALKYTSQAQNTLRSAVEIRRILKALAMHTRKSGAEAALEGGAAVSPYYGARPSVLCGDTMDSFASYGGW